MDQIFLMAGFWKPKNCFKLSVPQMPPSRRMQGLGALWVLDGFRLLELEGSRASGFGWHSGVQSYYGPTSLGSSCEREPLNSFRKLSESRLVRVFSTWVKLTSLTTADEGLCRWLGASDTLGCVLGRNVPSMLRGDDGLCNCIDQRSEL